MVNRNLAGERTIITLFIRIQCSIQALVITWLVSGAVFCLTIDGPGAMLGWVIWGTAFFFLGWGFVALPLIGLGRRVLEVPFWLLVLAGGLGGALVMALPILVFSPSLPTGIHLKLQLHDLL